MKRQREINELDLGNCLMLLSWPQESNNKKSLGPMEFECKTCNRKFSSFQALGGHRASHKKPKLEGDEIKAHAISLSLGNKPKMHECSICGQEFSLGQALGGHMRKHRAVMNEGFSDIKQVIAKIPILERSNSCARGMNMMRLDLNLTPTENDLMFGMKSPPVPLSLF